MRTTQYSMMDEHRYFGASGLRDELQLHDEQKVGLYGKSRGGENGSGQSDDPGSSPAWRRCQPFPT
jgi:hypothetical protein